MKRASWILLGIMATAIGLYPSIYFINERTFGLLGSKSPELLADVIWNIGFYGHIVPGGIALLIGWIQFNKSLRDRKLNLHRNIGKMYVIAVIISGLCGMYISFYATGGWIPATGFFALAVVWLYTTTMGFVAARNGKIDTHEKFMIYSYAACFAAVTLRIWLPLLSGMFGEFLPAYKIVAWLCWVPNLIFAYCLINLRSKKLA